jgi:hypothetical protein
MNFFLAIEMNNHRFALHRRHDKGLRDNSNIRFVEASNYYIQVTSLGDSSNIDSFT